MIQQQIEIKNLLPVCRSAWHDHLKTATKKALAEIQAVDLTPSEPIEQVAKKRRIEPTSPTEETRDQGKIILLQGSL